MNINVAVVSIAGTACKTTYTKHGLAPLIPNSVRICVDDWNSGDGVADLEISGKSFYQVAKQVNTDDRQSFLLDVGASNSKLMMRHFHDLELTREAINFWVVPVRPGSKERIDTLRTIAKLLEMSIPAKTIIVIAQAITDVEQFDQEFSQMKDAAIESGFIFAEQAVLFNEVFNMIKGSDQSVFDIVRSKPDFSAMRRAASGNEKKLIQIGNEMLIYSLALTASRNLLSVFQSTPLASAILNTDTKEM